MVAVWNVVVMAFRRESREAKLMGPVELFFCTSPQNATLERCFAKHQMMMDRLKESWKAEAEDERASMIVYAKIIVSHFQIL